MRFMWNDEIKFKNYIKSQLIEENQVIVEAQGGGGGGFFMLLGTIFGGAKLSNEAREEREKQRAEIREEKRKNKEAIKAKKKEIKTALIKAKGAAAKKQIQNKHAKEMAKLNSVLKKIQDKEKEWTNCTDVWSSEQLSSVFSNLEKSIGKMPEGELRTSAQKAHDLAIQAYIGEDGVPKSPEDLKSLSDDEKKALFGEIAKGLKSTAGYKDQSVEDIVGKLNAGDLEITKAGLAEFNKTIGESGIDDNADEIQDQIDAQEEELAELEEYVNKRDGAEKKRKEAQEKLDQIKKEEDELKGKLSTTKDIGEIKTASQPYDEAITAAAEKKFPKVDDIKGKLDGINFTQALEEAGGDVKKQKDAIRKVIIDKLNGSELEDTKSERYKQLDKIASEVIKKASGKDSDGNDTFNEAAFTSEGISATFLDSDLQEKLKKVEEESRKKAIENEEKSICDQVKQTQENVSKKADLEKEIDDAKKTLSQEDKPDIDVKWDNAAEIKKAVEDRKKAISELEERKEAVGTRGERLKEIRQQAVERTQSDSVKDLEKKDAETRNISQKARELADGCDSGEVIGTTKDGKLTKGYYDGDKFVPAPTDPDSDKYKEYKKGRDAALLKNEEPKVGKKHDVEIKEEGDTVKYIVDGEKVDAKQYAKAKAENEANAQAESKYKTDREQKVKDLVKTAKTLLQKAEKDLTDEQKAELENAQEVLGNLSKTDPLFKEVEKEESVLKKIGGGKDDSNTGGGEGDSNTGGGEDNDSFEDEDGVKYYKKDGKYCMEIDGEVDDTLSKEDFEKAKEKAVDDYQDGDTRDDNDDDLEDDEDENGNSTGTKDPRKVWKRRKYKRGDKTFTTKSYYNKKDQSISPEEFKEKVANWEKKQKNESLQYHIKGMLMENRQSPAYNNLQSFIEKQLR